jgi:phosphohistidine swiveling domain-containing protein
MTWVQESKRGRLSPFPNYLSMEAITSIMKQFTGYSYEKVLMVFREGMCNFFLDKEDKERVSRLALEKAKQDPEIIKRLTKEVEYLGKELISFVSQVFSCELEKLSNQELFNFYKKYCHDYKQIYARYFTILSMENPLLQYLKEYLISKHLDEELVSHYLSVLTTSTKAMFPKEEEKELLKIALLNLPEEELNKRIKEHRDKYFWLPADYEDPVWTEKDFRERLEQMIKEGKIKERLEEIENFYKNKKEEVKKVQELLKIDDFHAKLFELIRDGIYLKELRKKIVSESLYYVDGLQVEIGRRTNNSLKQMRQFLVDEIEEMLLSGMYHHYFARLRIELSACLIENGKTKIYCGEEAKELRDEVVQKPSTVNELRGLGVSPGKVQGKVKIVYDPSDIGKVEPGDIMVTVQAVPSFTPAIKIAGALVADGGTGITSHPATLAREAGIPCVTGVKIATEVLRDNEPIEVDGDKGIVRRIFK